MRRSLHAFFRHSVSCAFLSLSLLVLAGCGAGPGGRQPVSGTVTFKGAPLAHGTIEFEPAEQSTAASMEGGEVREGKYSLPAKQGLMPGKYQVRISSTEESGKAPSAESAPGEGPPDKELIPAQYNVNTKLTAEVTQKGPNNFNFDLK